MTRTFISLAISAVLATSACSSYTALIESTTSVAPETTTANAGSAVVDACVEEITALTAGIDLSAADATAQLENAFDADDGGEDCAFLVDGDIAATGLTEDELFSALEDALPPVVWEVLSGPAGQPFDQTVDEL